MKKVINSIKNFIINNKWFIITLIVCFIVCSPFAIWYIRGDDTYFHIINITAYGKSNIFSKILNWSQHGLGSGIGIFYPPLPHMLGGIIMHLGFSNIIAIKFVKVFTIFLSSLFMYFLSKEIYEDSKKAMFSSIFYITSSYFLVNVFVRDVINESFIFVAMPLIYLGIYKLFYKNDKKMFIFLFSIGYIIMIYSHLVLTVFFTILLFIFLLINIKKLFSNKNIIYFIISAVIILIFTSTFTVPLIEHLIVGKWHLPPAYKWTFPIKGYFVLQMFRSGSNGLIYVYIPFIMYVLIAFGIYTMNHNKKNISNKPFLLGVILIGFVAMILTGFDFFWDHCPKFLLNIQLTCRLACFVVFSFSLFVPAGLDAIYNFFKKKYSYVLTIILLLLVIYNINFNFKKFKFQRNVEYNGNYHEDYVPKKSHLKSEKLIYSVNPEKIEIKKGNGDLKTYNIDTTHIKFTVDNIEDNIVLQIPRFYYLGYQIKDSKGNEYNYDINNLGLIELNLSKNDTYDIKYTGTKYYKICLIAKYSMLIILTTFLLFLKVNRKNKKRTKFDKSLHL